MRIDQASAAALAAMAQRQRAKDTDRPAFEVDLGRKAGETRSSVGPGAPAGLDTLLALQMVPAAGDPLERRRRGVKRGRTILSALDDLKVAILEGRVPIDRLAHLAASVGERERDSGDEKLEALLDEIELRARVELAKLGR